MWACIYLIGHHSTLSCSFGKSWARLSTISWTTLGFLAALLRTCLSDCCYLSLPPVSTSFALSACHLSSLFTLSPRSSLSLSFSFSPSWWQHVYLLLMLWLGSLPAPLSPHFPPACPTSPEPSRGIHRCTSLSVCETKVVITLSVYCDMCVFKSVRQKDRD